MGGSRRIIQPEGIREGFLEEEVLSQALKDTWESAKQQWGGRSGGRRHALRGGDTDPEARGNVAASSGLRGV